MEEKTFRDTSTMQNKNKMSQISTIMGQSLHFFFKSKISSKVKKNELLVKAKTFCT